MKNKTVTIIQARMASTRLPGKILSEISGRLMLWHIVDRLKQGRMTGEIVVATSTNGKDDPVEDFCKEGAIEVFRGSEEDVLDRYYQAARLYGAEVVVRITGDCPLIDPCITDKVISSYLDNASSFAGASNTMNRMYPRGLDTEVITFSTLEDCWKKAKKLYQREHVTIYIHEQLEAFKMLSVENDKDLSHLRWTVDETVDLQFVREIYKRLYKDGETFLLQDVLKVLQEEPYLNEINKGVKQKVIV